MKGKFIILEGGEGSGKTLQSQRMVAFLKKKKFKVLLTREPGSTVIAERIREVILYHDKEKLNPKAELFLFLASRAQHVEQKILPALKKGYIVICDRFSGSTLAYQIGGRHLTNEKLIKQMDDYAKDYLKEDLVLYLDTNPIIGLKRKVETLKNLTNMDKEKLFFHRQVRKYFQKLAKNNKQWVSINADKKLDENTAEIFNILSKKLNIK